ncbi:MAG: NAD(P)(+) transhydrogenase (Re/Si-specific) subunit alpha, partial [Spirochaetales bacterium]|nr:NAD(P)(+) transhydrogenase (Re/Si-specific) subunit alpha [Spirochaetales bacterium]
MLVAVPKEIKGNETRVALVPESVKKLVSSGLTVHIESGLGEYCRFDDDKYREAGAEVISDRKALLASADMVVRVNKPPEDEIDLLKSGCIHISYLDPFNEKPLVEKLAAAGILAVSMELIPRTTKAQKMDALSSQASLAGYVAVIQAAEYLDAVFPMMT